MNNEYMFLFEFDNLERRTVTAKGITYIVAKESLDKLLSLIANNGNEEEKRKAKSVDDKIACYVPDDIFKTVSDDELLQYVNEHIYDGGLLTPEPSREDITDMVYAELCNTTEDILAMQIAERIVDDVIVDLKETSDYPAFNDSDVRIAIGRVLVDALERKDTATKPQKIIRFA